MNQNIVTKIKNLRPIDDIFFQKLMEDIQVCQEMLQVILEDDSLVVESVTPQNSIKNLQGRSVRLDALCTLGNGRKCNIEVQKEDNDNHVKRVRYNASCITANITKTGSSFEDVPDVCIVYLSMFDFLKGDKTIYHTKKILQETGASVEDGLQEIYVNTEIYDGTNISELMQCMKQETIANRKFPALARRVNYYKESQEGVDTMCDVMKELIEERDKEIIINLLKQGCSYDMIARAYYISEDAVKEIEQLALQMA